MSHGPNWPNAPYDPMTPCPYDAVTQRLNGRNDATDTMDPIDQIYAGRIIRPKKGLVEIDFRELWRYRELFWFLAWRDVLVRYKQTVIGVAWAALQPLLTMVVFTIVFGRLAKFPSHDAPYAVMTFAALLPWQFFANAMSQSSNSLVGSAHIISKVYFPRLIVPVSATVSGVVDLSISLVILLGLILWHGVPLTIHLLLLPLFFIVGFMAAFAVGLWLSALNVKYRDVKYVTPFLVRMGLFVSPVGFMSSVVPQKWQFWYSLNPMVGVIDGFRWCILGPRFEPYWVGFWSSFGIVMVLLISGAYYFRFTEKTFADVI
jgi:lipopolysaccharide transport system permease protein